jgi:hypothetical protein
LGFIVALHSLVVGLTGRKFDRCFVRGGSTTKKADLMGFNGYIMANHQKNVIVNIYMTGNHDVWFTPKM